MSFGLKKFFESKEEIGYQTGVHLLVSSSYSTNNVLVVNNKYILPAAYNSANKYIGDEIIAGDSIVKSPFSNELYLIRSFDSTLYIID